MRVCVFGTRGFPDIEGGVEKHCERLYPLVDEDVSLIVFRRRIYVCSDETYANVTFVDLPSTKIKGVEALVHSFFAAVQTIRMKPDVVHIHNIGPALFSPLLKLFSIPVILTYHSPNYEHKKWGRFAKWLLRFSERVALKCADQIIFVNRFQMEKYPPKIRQKSVYLPNGITTPEVAEQQDCLEQFGLKNQRYILSVGRITPEKGFHTLIEAFSKLEEPDCKLVIAGGVEFEGEYMEKLRKQAEGKPVVFTGYVYGETLRQLYSHAQLYVLASENEGFPLVLLEAMGYRCDVLVSDIPATHLVDLPEEDYFPAADAESLCKKIDSKLKKPVKREYDLSGFTWEECARQVSRIYHNIAQ